MARFTILTIATLLALAVSTAQAAPATSPVAIEERGLFPPWFSPQPQPIAQAPAQPPPQSTPQGPAQPAPVQPQPHAPARAPTSGRQRGGDCGRPGDEQECQENENEPDLVEAGVKPSRN